MPKSKTPRKKYRPKPVIADPVGYVVSGLRPVDSDNAVRVKIINHSAMQQLTRGLGTRDDWDYVCTALNIAVVLAELGVGAEYVEQIRDAMLCHTQCGRRFYTHGKVGYSGPELGVVNFALEVHDAQVDAATVGEMEKAHMEVARRLRADNITHKVKEEA